MTRDEIAFPRNCVTCAAFHVFRPGKLFSPAVGYQCLECVPFSKAAREVLGGIQGIANYPIPDGQRNAALRPAERRDNPSQQ